MNEFVVFITYDISDLLIRLNTNHKVFTVNEELPDEYVINIFTTLKALESVKETFYWMCSRLSTTWRCDLSTITNMDAR